MKGCSTDLWLDRLTLGKRSVGRHERRGAAQMALFSPFSPPDHGREFEWLFMSVWDCDRGCSETHQPSLFCEGRAWLKCLSVVWF